MKSLQRAPHDYRSSLQVFVDLDVEKIAADMDLQSEGRQRGEANEPPSKSPALDSVETKVVERIGEEQKAAHGLLEDGMQVYARRFAALDLDGKLGEVRMAGPSCITDINNEVSKALDDLHGVRRDLTEHERERDDFRERHRLTRVARMRGRGAWTFKIGLIALLLLTETALNGVFLGENNVGGWLGGTTLAFAFAFLNVIAPFILAVFVMVRLNHRSWFQKFFGLLSIVAYIALALALNLALAHYRELAGRLSENAGTEVIQRILVNPLAIEDIMSWLFFGVGVLWSVIAVIDGLYFFDSYPGYEGVEKRLVAARLRFADEKHRLIDELTDIGKSYAEQIADINRSLSALRGEYDSMVQGQRSLIQRFQIHQAHLERAGQSLLEIYRDANKAARSTSAPRRFSSAFTLERIELPEDDHSDEDRREMKAKITAAQEALHEQNRSIQEALTEATQKYRLLDDLVPEVPLVQAA